ncbi:Endoglucanase 3 [Hordeum vulgare]|nr:Endoglucanase 3 [Hordeum vulgare]
MWEYDLENPDSVASLVRSFFRTTLEKLWKALFKSQKYWRDDEDEAKAEDVTDTYKRSGRPHELAMCVQKPDEPLRDYVTRWMELRNSCEGVHELQVIQYFIEGCRDDTLLKHKLMCSEPTSLVALMAKADKYATVDSAMRIKISAKDKPVQPLATTKPAGDNQGRKKTSTRRIS